MRLRERLDRLLLKNYSLIVVAVVVIVMTLVIIAGGPYLLQQAGYIGPPSTEHVDQPVAETKHDAEQAGVYLVDVAHGPSVPNYIAVELLGLTFTEEGYHDRVRDQIEEEGYKAICVLHLETLAREAVYLSVNSARQNLVYVTECAAAREAIAP